MSDDPKKPDEEAEDLSEARTVFEDGADDPTVVKEPVDASEAPTLYEDIDLDDSEAATIVQTAEVTVPYGQTPGLANAPNLDGYNIFDKLGEGGMGVVWRAIQLSTNREVALKLLPPAVIGSEKAQVRFQREVETAASLEHPNIASIYDSGLNKGIYYYAMQSIDGIELNSYVKAKELGEKAIIELMIKLSEAVHFAHLNGIVHRDLKPGNVLVTKAEGEPKILDFGLAKSFTGEDPDNDVSIAGEVVGTPMYMSTEQARGEVDNIDGRTDVYALGVMLFELITKGEFPYSRAGGPYDIIRRKFTEEPTRPRTIDAKIDIDLEAVILKAIEADPDKRYESADLFAQDLAHYLKGHPVSARRHTSGYLFSKWFRRNRMAIAATLILLLAALAYYQIAADKAMRDAEKETAGQTKELKAQTETATKKMEAAQLETAQFASRTKGLYTNKIAALKASLDGANLAAARAHMDEVDALGKTEDGAKYLSGFAGQLTALNERIETMQASASEMEAGIARAVKDFTSLGENQIAAEADLNDSLLAELNSLAERHKAVLKTDKVQARLDQVAQKIEVFARNIMEDRRAIENRPVRLAALRKFITSSRLRTVIPSTESLELELAEKEKLHVFYLINRAQQSIRLEQTATRESFVLKPDEEKIFALAIADPAAFVFSSVVLNDEGAVDPAFLGAPVDVEPINAGGSMIELTFTRKRIRLSAQSELADVKMRHSENEKGPWEEFVPDLTVLPGLRYVRYDRPDHRSFTNGVPLPVEQDDLIVGLPEGLDWGKLRRTYLSVFEQAQAAAADGDNVQALKLLSAIQLTDIESPRLRDRVASFLTEQKAHPRVVVPAKLPGAEAAIEDFITAYIQRYNPLGSRAKPFRFQQGDQLIPNLNLPVFKTDRLALLNSPDRERYACAMIWQEYFTTYTPANLDRERSRIAGMLEAGAENLPSIKNHMLAQVAVLKRTRNSQVPTSEELALNDPLIHQWMAHARFAASVPGSDASLKSWQDFQVAGGKPDHFDTAVALYAAFFLIDEVVEGLVRSGVGPTHRNWANDAAGMLQAAEKLGTIMDVVSEPDLEAAMKMIESNSRAEKDQRDVFIAHILSECLERGDPKEAYAVSILARRKNELNLSANQKLEFNSRLNTMNF